MSPPNTTPNPAHIKPRTALHKIPPKKPDIITILKKSLKDQVIPSWLMPLILSDIRSHRHTKKDCSVKNMKLILSLIALLAANAFGAEWSIRWEAAKGETMCAIPYEPRSLRPSCQLCQQATQKQMRI
jgi:hypothetical protein